MRLRHCNCLPKSYIRGFELRRINFVDNLSCISLVTVADAEVEIQQIKDKNKEGQLITIDFHKATSIYILLYNYDPPLSDNRS